MPLTSILVSWGYKLSHTLGGLKQQKSILSPFWSPRVWNAGVARAPFSLKALGENLLLVVPASGGPGHFMACGTITPVSVSDFTWHSSLCLWVLSVFLTRTLVIFSVHPNPVWSRLNLYLTHICKESISEIRPCSEVLGGREFSGRGCYAIY